MVSVRQWTGREASVLRAALRMSMRAFAEHLGVALRTVAKWESLGAETQPRPDTQAILDTALAHADAAAHARFEAVLFPERKSVRPADYETWTEDIERAVVCVSRQDFPFAATLLNRWLASRDAHGLDDKGLYLYGRSLVLLGDVQRDQGAILGPLSARQSYLTARDMFSELAIPRRVAQIELSLAVVQEMSGQLDVSARWYEQLAADQRLSRRDRARARLWIGTALSKEGNNEYATNVMAAATREFEELGEPEDWSVAHQKLALAHRGAGDLKQALHYIDIARTTGTVDSPMQRVRLDTAYGHILLSDTATRNDGLSVLDQAAQVARQFGLSHQLRSIEGIRSDQQG
ncbi:MULTISPECIES: helix-turn-helix domain-containing protein [unclassified Streptomyces]|uniref:helix-turn-helix domain-containing protein n=1 Tax=unclassified Streptomyces TaxID=2593676 RepID=UPI00364A3C90